MIETDLTQVIVIEIQDISIVQVSQKTLGVIQDHQIQQTEHRNIEVIPKIETDRETETLQIGDQRMEFRQRLGILRELAM